MKKIVLVLTAGLMAFSLAACGGSSTKETTTAATTGAATEATSSSTDDKGYTFTVSKDVVLYMDEDATVIEQLGEYKDYTESSSCAFEGMDKSYYYGSYYVLTGSLSGREFISGLYFADDTVCTDEGLYLGDKQSVVEELYGKDGYNGSNAYVMEKGSCKLTIIVNNGEVTGITYTVIK